jgi:hypothetical protein
MNWFVDVIEQKQFEQAYEELLRIGYGMDWLDAKGWLNKKGQDISRSYYNRIVEARDFSRLGLIAVCVGIVEEEWYCYKPALRGFEEKDRGYVYAIIDDGSFKFSDNMCSVRFKIGFSKNPQKRVKSIQTASPQSRLFYFVQALKQTEKYVHDSFADLITCHRIGKSEWFEFRIQNEVCIADMERAIRHLMKDAIDSFFKNVTGAATVRYPEYEDLKKESDSLQHFMEKIRYHEDKLHAGDVRSMQDAIAFDMPGSKKLDAYGVKVSDSYLEYVEKDVDPPYRLLGEAFAVAYLGWHSR